MQALVTFDDSWDEEAIRNAFTDNENIAGVRTVEIVQSHCGKCARQDTKELGTTGNKQSAPLVCDGCGNEMDEGNKVNLCHDCYSMVAD